MGPIDVLVVRSKTAYEGLRHLWSFASDEITNIFSSLVSIYERHLKVHHDQVVSSLMLFEELFDFCKGLVSIVGNINLKFRFLIFDKTFDNDSSQLFVVLVFSY